MAKWTVLLWDAPSQTGFHFQIFPELEGQCPLPEVNEVTNICDALPYAFQFNLNVLGFELSNTSWEITWCWL